MNIEGNMPGITPDGFRNEHNIRSVDLASFTVNEYLRPYLSEQPDNPFVSAATANSLKRVIPQLIVDVLVSVQGNLGENGHLTIGGSSMEVFSRLISPELYWATKKHLIDAFVRPEIAERPDDLVKNAVHTLAHGDADLDLYVEKDAVLRKIFDRFHSLHSNAATEETESGGERFKTGLIDDSGISLSVSLGPVYKGNDVKRLHFQLTDKQNNPLFHIDMTTNDQSAIRVFNRRQDIGNIHDQCRGEIDLETGEVNIDLNSIPKASEQSTPNVTDKDVGAIFETVMRETRKKLFHIAFDNQTREKMSIYQLVPFVNSATVFSLKEIMSGRTYDPGKIFDIQSEYQKQILYQELFLMAQIDPYLTIVFLQDTGFDALFFGRHLTRREGLRILASPWLNMNNQVDISNKHANNNSMESVNRSRQKFLELKSDDPNRDGFVRFISAIGQALGDHQLSFKEHFQDGLDIIGNRGDKLPELKPWINPELDETLSEMYSVIVEQGNLTEKRLHTILHEKNPEKYPKSETGRDIIMDRLFRYMFFKLKASGMLEVVRRTVFANGEIKEVDFYYPSESNVEINQLLPIKLDGNNNQLTPDKPGYWEKVLQSNPQMPSVTPVELTTAWRFMVISGINSIEALLTINESDLEMMQEIRPKRDALKTLKEYLILRQSNPDRSWFDYPRLDI